MAAFAHAEIQPNPTFKSWVITSCACGVRRVFLRPASVGGREKLSGSPQHFFRLAPSTFPRSKGSAATVGGVLLSVWLVHLLERQ